MQNLFRVIRLFSIDEKPDFEITDKVHDFNGRPDLGLYSPDIKWEEIAEHYKLPEKTGDWDFQKDTHEQVFNLRNSEVLQQLGGSLTLKGDWVTYYDILACLLYTSPSPRDRS